jgi:hypothetical protein
MSQNRDGLYNNRKGFIIKPATTPSHIKGQVVGKTNSTPIRENDNQKAEHKPARMMLGI